MVRCYFMKYVLLGYIDGIGGWQLYIDCRASYLCDNGHDVYIISVGTGDNIRIESFLSKKILSVPELKMPPQSYTKRQQSVILNKILGFLGDGSEVLLECTNINLSIWGEIIASYYQGRSYAFILQSHISQRSSYIKDFFWYKYNRDELAGQTTMTLPDMFENYVHSNEIEPRTFRAISKWPISEQNTIQDLTEKIKEYKQQMFVVGYFGSLEKEHFCQLCDFICNYANNNNLSILFVSIGSSESGMPERIQVKKENDKCKMINIPAMFPIPKQLFQELDVCIASYGSAIYAARAGALTIRLLNDISIIPQGLMGIDIIGEKNERNYKDIMCSYTLEELLNKIYKEEYSKKDIDTNFSRGDYIAINKSIDNFIFNVTPPKDYYDVSKIKFISNRVIVEKILNCLLGVNITKKAVEKLKMAKLRISNIKNRIIYANYKA